MARKSKKPQSESSGGGWITSYADLMTLLLCFFVLLYAMSTVDEQKFQAAMQSIQDALMGTSGKTIFEVIQQEGEVLSGDMIENLEMPAEDFVDYGMEGEANGDELFLPEVAANISDSINEFLESQGLTSEMSVELVEEGLQLDIKENVFFDLGEATIKAESITTLNKLLNLFEKFDNEIRVIGHTDNIPINTNKYASNWELAAARACAIVRYYATQSLDANRFVCTSYGETKPIANNDTEEGRMQNRRVNFLIQATPTELQEIADDLKQELGGE